MKFHPMRIALAQINPTVGDIAGNTRIILERIAAARSAGAHLVLIPELAIFGYPPKDLVLKRRLVERNVQACEEIAAACTGITAVVGFVQPDASGEGKALFNAAAACQHGRIIAKYEKNLLPTYDVFDEARYFNAGTRPCVIDVPHDGARGSTRVGVTICEDLWHDAQYAGRRVYGVDPIERTVQAGAELIVNISASPFETAKEQTREDLFSRQAARHARPIAYCNQVGGNDDLIFDGASHVIDAGGRIIARANSFEEDMLLVDLADPASARVAPQLEYIERVYRALVLGTRDYVHKCGFSDVVLGLSGGIDSAVTAAIAVAALGADHVHGYALPSRYSSDHSLADAQELAANLGMSYQTLPIEGPHAAMEQALAPIFANAPSGVAEENVQARLRGNLLMAISNKRGWLLLTTGNKSELAVGYCTLYGDMSGGLAVLSDVPKTVVYTLARYINRIWRGPCIPERTITKPPSAELKPNQADQDTLPPYDLLDAVLERYIEREQSVEEIAEAGFDGATVERIARLVDISEYKRKQAAVGLKVTSRAFGTGRRMPIAARQR
jgi:NAD+ synthase/NAD+ synthase (glutamine-hydrolysing)